MGLQVAEKDYEHKPERATNANSSPVMQDIPVITGSTVLTNWPDTVLHDKKKTNLSNDCYSHNR